MTIITFRQMARLRFDTAGSEWRRVGDFPSGIGMETNPDLCCRGDVHTVPCIAAGCLLRSFDCNATGRTDDISQQRLSGSHSVVVNQDVHQRPRVCISMTFVCYVPSITLSPLCTPGHHHHTHRVRAPTNCWQLKHISQITKLLPLRLLRAN